ncbi:MAG TPA: hypothetical protein VFA46_00770 [Actinomycetes bacterium]|jgi:hypothetical protein|nr:hypothetical protein [Actinomycetes bacterium]
MDAQALVGAAVEPSGAEWIAPRLLPWWSLPGGEMPVGAIIPIGFDAYARILHPAHRKAGGREVPVRWRELAEWAGVAPHAEMQWDEIAPPRGQVGAERLHLPPQEGHLPAEEAEALVAALRRHSTTPDRCWFAVWEGFGALEPDRRWPGIARLHLPNRNYVLFHGPIDAAVRSFEPLPFRQSANFWWPQDQAWCVATEIDYAWTYVAGTESCIDDLLAESRLEALRIRPNQRAGGRHTA